MNESTLKALTVIEMTSFMTHILKQKKYLENELHFLAKLDMLLTNHTDIDTSKVNGNEVYVIFNADLGNEQSGWK